MGDVLPFGQAADDNAMSRPISTSGVGDLPSSTKEQPPQAGAAAPVPPDPVQLQQTIDGVVYRLRVAAQRASILPAKADNNKRDLMVKAVELETSAMVLRERIVPASGSDENLTVRQDLDHLLLDVTDLTQAVEKALVDAGIIKPVPEVKKGKPVWPVLGIIGLGVAGLIVYAYFKADKED